MNLPFLEGSDGNVLIQIFSHASDHALVGEGRWWGFGNLAVMLWISCAVLLLLVLKADKSGLSPRGKCRNILEMIYLFVRDDMVYPTIGKKHGKAYVPFFVTLFSLLLTMNLMGLVPIPGVAGAAASTIGFTIPIAVIVLLVGVIGGLKANGVKGFLGAFVPPGLPVALVPVLFVLEVFGFLIKHGVLAVRLFANMLAGHLVIGALLGLILLFKSYGIAVVAIPMATGIMFLELLVAFLQAYVFTLISVLAVGSVVHPEH